MKKGFFLFLAFACSFLPGKSQKTGNYSVAFYNIENLFDTQDDPKIDDAEFLPGGKNEWTDSRYKVKLDNMAKVIAGIGDADGPEIIGLAEVENRKVLEDLIGTSALKNRGYSIIHFDSPDERGIDVAMLYKGASFKPLYQRNIPVQLAGTEVDFTRDMLYVKGISGKKDTLHIFVNHWPSRSGGQEKSDPKRMDAALAGKKTIDSLLAVNTAAKIIFMGDLNDDPKDKSIAEGLGVSFSPVAVKHLFDPMEAILSSGQGTLSYKGKWNLFDQIILSPGLLSGKKGMFYQANSAAIYKPDWMCIPSGDSKGNPKRTFSAGKWFADGFSDHFPVYVKLVVKK